MLEHQEIAKGLSGKQPLQHQSSILNNWKAEADRLNQASNKEGAQELHRSRAAVTERLESSRARSVGRIW